MSSHLLPSYAEVTHTDHVGSTSNFVQNMRLPVHRWFRFSAGFSAEWAKNLIAKAGKDRPDLSVLDPFVGVGTTVLASEEAGFVSYGLEAQPFIARIAKAKLLWNTSPEDFTGFAEAVSEIAESSNGSTGSYPKLIHKCFPPKVLVDLHNLKLAWQETNDGTPAAELTWLALCSILRRCSPVGTAPWTYILPRKTKTKPALPFDAFKAQTALMASDMILRKSLGFSQTGKILTSDAREAAQIEADSIDLVVTSPPYANNFDYADATRLEMSFLGDVHEWGGLQKFRRELIHSSTQHVSIENLSLKSTLQGLDQTSIFPEISSVCDQLARERPKHGGKKDYGVMVAAYFNDMNKVWMMLRRVCKDGAILCLIIGDSAPYGVYVPVEKWLGELSVNNGFKSFHFEKLRDRNTRWKNRKHRVPLHEGRLWIEG